MNNKVQKNKVKNGGVGRFWYPSRWTGTQSNQSRAQLSWKYEDKKEGESEPKIKYIVNNKKCRAENESATTLQATIRTKSKDPLWTKQYPYPMSDNNFILTLLIFN